MNKILLMMCALLITLTNAAIAASTKQNTEINSASDQAWNYYQEKKYKEARNIVNKYYIKEHVSLALLSGLLYAGENKCKEALDAIQYVSSYYDEHGVDILAGKTKATEAEEKEESDTKKAYQSLKLIGFKCNKELKQWQDAIHDVNIYLQNKPDDLGALSVLGESSMQFARVNINTSIQAFERVIKLNGKNDGVEDISATDYANFNLAVLYSWDGQHEKAVKVASSLLSESKKPQKILDGMKSSSDYKPILNDKEMMDVIKSLGLKK